MAGVLGPESAWMDEWSDTSNPNGKIVSLSASECLNVHPQSSLTKATLQLPSTRQALRPLTMVRKTYITADISNSNQSQSLQTLLGGAGVASPLSTFNISEIVSEIFEFLLVLTSF